MHYPTTSGYFNFVTYAQYAAALALTNSGDAEDASIQIAGNLPLLAPSTQISITSALGAALGFTNLNGIQASSTNTTIDGGICTIGAAGCYDGVLELVTPAALIAETGDQSLYYPGLSVGAQANNQYNVFSVVEHETDEILGTTSCNSVGAGSVVSSGCFGAESAADLFRYNAGAFVPDSADSNKPGAYFSSNGGATADTPAYNTTVADNDYGDFLNTNSNGVACSYVQSMQGCPGASTTQDIATDGGAEVRMLDGVGFNLVPATVIPVTPSATPEPSSLALFGTGIAAIGGVIRRRRRTA